MARKPAIQYIQFYTDGTAARKPEIQAPVKKKSKLPKAKKRKVRVLHVDPLALGGIIVSAIMLILMMVGTVQLYALQQETVQMESYVAELSTMNAELQHTYDIGYDLGAVEEMALALGMIPAEEATTITIRVPQPVPEEPTSVWENFRTFLAGVFA